MLYDLYQAGDSWLHRLDPRAKLLFVVCQTTALLLLGNLWIMLVALVLSHALILSAGISRHRIAWVWRMALPMMVMIAVLWVIFNRDQGPILWRLWFVEVSASNIARGLAVSLRIGALAFCFFVWLFTTDQTRLVRGLVALGLPYDWGLTLAMALRYLPTMSSTFRMISEAQQARGLDLQRGSLLTRARNYMPITVSMLITALRTADSLAHALESRALGASSRRTSLRQLHFGLWDILWSVATVSLTAGVLWARYALGFGGHPFLLFP